MLSFIFFASVLNAPAIRLNLPAAIPCPENPTFAELCLKHSGSWGSGDKCTGNLAVAKQSVIDLKGSHVGHNYQDFYPSLLSHLRCEHDLAFLEIGVAEGYSVAMWREFFTTPNILHFIDISDESIKHEMDGTKVWIGDGTTASMLQQIATTAGGSLDLVVDDGSHRPQDIRNTFLAVFPLLKPGGIYVIEDLNTAWDDKGAPMKEIPVGNGLQGSHVDLVKSFIDTLNRQNFDSEFTADVDKVDHHIASIYCMREICALTKAAS